MGAARGTMLKNKLHLEVFYRLSYIYKTPFNHELDMTQGQFMSKVIAGLNSEFYFYTGSQTKAKEPTLFFKHNQAEKSLIHFFLTINFNF